MATFEYASNIIIGSRPQNRENSNVTKQVNFDQYTRDTLAVLDEIVKTSFTGWGLIMKIREHSQKRIVITPMLSSVENAFAKNKPEWSGANELQILYNPGAWPPGGSSRPGTAPDEVLLHELLHAYRMMNGSFSYESCDSAPFFYDIFDEFFAILLTNIHRAARQRKGLRKDHHSNNDLYPELSTSRSFLLVLGKHTSWVRRVVTEEFGYCNDAIRKDRPFNPIDYFLANSQECMDHLESLKFEEFNRGHADESLENSINDMMKVSERLLREKDKATPGGGKPAPAPKRR